MKTHITLLMLILVGFTSCSRHYSRKGNSYYQTMQYDKAIKNFNKTENHNSEIKTKLAHSYRLNNDYKNAERFYAELSADPASDPSTHFFYGRMLMNNGKYNEAKKSFLNYLVLNDSDPLAEMLIKSCDSCEKLHTAHSDYTVRPLEIPGVVTAFAQVQFGEGLVFAADKDSDRKKSGWTGRSYLDLYFSQPSESGKWTDPEPLKGSVNGPYHEGPAVFNNDRTKIYFTRSNYSGSKKLNKSSKDESNLKVFSAELSEGSWTNLTELPFNSDEYSCGHPALSPDGKTLYFISDMPRGQGGTDLYKVTLDEQGEWSFPENLGDKVNTPGNEMFPYIAANGTLYFSSDALTTLGGLDIFSSAPDGKSWEAPKNLNYPINTPKDDFAFTMNADEKTGFISSNRDSIDRIYEVILEDPAFLLRGKVVKKESGNALLDAVVEVTNNKDNYIQVLSTDDFGRYSMKLKPGVEYKIQAQKEGYLKPEVTTVSTVNKQKSEVFKADFALEKLQIGKPMILDNIYYDLDRWTIRQDAAAELDKFAELLKNNPQIKVEMSAHTDARANDTYNQNLSERRAKAAVDYLIKKGISPSRLNWKGFGETVLINDCGNGADCPEDRHQQNRRTEFKVLEVSELASHGQ